LRDCCSRVAECDDNRRQQQLLGCGWELHSFLLIDEVRNGFIADAKTVFIFLISLMNPMIFG
ncbi:MAG: hypothetical protein P8R41_09710, partial [Gammaproteobacteria bacterium]|nr:hypothetical protein [Gammaproteobacteria bacterium]